METTFADKIWEALNTKTRAAAIDVVYQILDEAQIQGHFELVDHLCKELLACEFPLYIYLSALVITLRDRVRFSDIREELAQRVRDRLIAENDKDRIPRILIGLV